MGAKLKKILLLLLLLSSFAVKGYCVDYTSDANVVAAYLFDEGSGTTVDDSTANSNVGNFKASGEPAWAAISGTGAPTYATYSVDFDATDDLINCASDTTIDDVFINGGSFVGWIFVEGTGEGNFGYLFGKTQVTGPFGSRLTTDDSSGTNRLFFGLNSNSGADTNPGRITNNNIYTDSVWAHTAVLKDDNSITATTLHIYVDGVEATYAQTTNGVGTLTSDGSYTLMLGNRNGSDRTFNGDITENAFFKRVISSTEINDIMDNGLVGGGAPAARRLIMVSEE